MINLKEHIGEPFSASIYGVNCTGKIQIENDLIYLCQNEYCGVRCEDTLGYKYSFELKANEYLVTDNGNIYIIDNEYQICNFKLLLTSEQEEISKWKLNSILVNNISHSSQKILFISEYIVMLGQDDYCKATYTKLELYNDGWRLHN